MSPNTSPKSGVLRDNKMDDDANEESESDDSPYTEGHGDNESNDD